jgi:NitT/TauT family transport system permease protein
MTSTSAVSARTGKAARAIGPVALAACVWLVVWQLAAMAIGRDFLVATPGQVVVRLAELATTTEFWATVATTLLKITLGFVTAVAVGALTAALAASFRVIEVLLAPIMSTIRAVPVVSFIILVLLWADASTLASITAFLMVLPVMFASILAGIRSRDRLLLEAASVFDVTVLRRVRAIDLPAVLPFFAAACRIGIGLAWKAGVAAEVIGITQGSIGERLYQAKVFLEPADVFAWTVVIVALSIACEWAVQRGIRRAQSRLAGGVA